MGDITRIPLHVELSQEDIDEIERTCRQPKTTAVKLELARDDIMCLRHMIPLYMAMGEPERLQAVLTDLYTQFDALLDEVRTLERICYNQSAIR